MKLKSRATFAASLIAAACMFAAGGAHAGATILNSTGNLALGINADGSLNTCDGAVAVNGGRSCANGATATGLAFVMTPTGGTPAFYDATSPGCLCEGWGVAATTAAAVTHHGGADVDVGGINNLTVGAMTGVTATTATTTASLATLSGLTVTQAYSQADHTSSLFKDVVTIKNTSGGALSDVKYVRVMDWDIPFTEFNEFVTIKGTATTTLREFSNDNGFCNPDPSVACSAILGGTTNVDFTDSGPTDHGAYFRFNFGSLADGDSVTFTIFYGAATSERAALAALGSESVELFSLGQSAGDPTGGTPATFMFGFSGVGGVPVIPTPTPGSLALVGAALLAAGALRRRRA